MSMTRARRNLDRMGAWERYDCEVAAWERRRAAVATRAVLVPTKVQFRVVKQPRMTSDQIARQIQTNIDLAKAHHVMREARAKIEAESLTVKLSAVLSDLRRA